MLLTLGLILIVVLVAFIVILFAANPKRSKPFPKQSYVSPILFDGLGNQLFQMAAAHAYAKQASKVCAIYKKNCSQSKHTSQSYIDSIFSKWPRTKLAPDSVYNADSKNPWSTEPIPIITCKHLSIKGWFQNESFIGPFLQDFIHMLSLPSGIPVMRNHCFLHIRLGDYENNPAFGLNLVKSYFPKALELVRRKRTGSKFLVFTNNLARCKKLPLLNSPDIEFCLEQDEVKSLVLMSQCHVGGICSNSTFSWWGAFLNPNKKRLVTFPATWVLNQSQDIHIQFKGSVLLPVN